jgi:hypothetical protein
MSNANIERSVGQLEGTVGGLQKDMGEVKATLAGQDVKLDQLLAYHNRQKGARGITKAAFSVVASGGFLGWIWEHFTK